jgi:ABC-type nitrate/sulfonate/bicarbonate transport system permease component
MRFMGRSSNKQAATTKRNGRSVRVSDMLIGIASVVVILVVWQIAATQGWISDYHFPPPSKLAKSLNTLVTTGFPKGVTVFSHMWATVWRILKGYALATLLAIPIGLLIGRSPGLDRAANPIITFARSVATISLLPLAVAWFGVGELSRVLLITYGCFWIILTNVVHGVKNVDPTLMLAAETLGASKRQIFFRVVLPASLPRIFSGMKVALGLAFLVIVAVEMIGTIEGLGALIMEARTFYRTGIMMVGMLIIALFGFVLTKGLDWLEQYLLPWSVGLEEVER